MLAVIFGHQIRTLKGPIPSIKIEMRPGTKK